MVILLFLSTAWESVDAHHAFQANTELYSKLLAAFGPVRAPDSLPSLYHVDFKPIAVPRDHFARPVTEIVVHTLKEGKTAEEIEGLMLQERMIARFAGDVSGVWFVFRGDRLIDVLQILLGLDYLHKQGIAHRDVRSDNLLINNSGVVRISESQSCVLLVVLLTFG